MSDRDLIIAAAEKVMGWARVGQPSFSPNAFRWQSGPHDYPLIWWNDAVHIEQLEGWNPLTSDADAFMLVDALKSQYRAAFVLGSNGCADQWTAWVFDGIWALGAPQNLVPEHGDPHLLGCATAEDRRRAIVLATLRAAGEKA